MEFVDCYKQRITSENLQRQSQSCLLSVFNFLSQRIVGEASCQSLDDAIAEA